MRRLAAICMAAALIAVGACLPAIAVLPEEVLDDPTLEARARSISTGLRCLVCQNQSIDDSDADLARDLRVLVRERLVAGDTDEEVMEFIVSRYGEFVLLKPSFNLQNALLWTAPFAILIVGGCVLFFSVKKRQRPAQGTAGLTDAEQARLDNILHQREHDS